MGRRVFEFNASELRLRTYIAPPYGASYDSSTSSFVKLVGDSFVRWRDFGETYFACWDAQLWVFLCMTHDISASGVIFVDHKFAFSHCYITASASIWLFIVPFAVDAVETARMSLDS